MATHPARAQSVPRCAAVVGAGPAGLYALAALLKGDAFDHIDVFEAAPAPYGLVRYGVAPDHPKTRNISRVLARGLEHDQVRFLGNVTVGEDISIDDLRSAYDVVVVSTGMLGDRSLNIPGEDLSGSLGASELVAWYTGHPEAKPIELPADLRTATVIGAGNVALDVARILTKHPSSLRPTSMPRHVVDALEANTLTDVHIVARRGPAQVKFTSPELHEIGDLDDIDLVVDPADLVLSPDDERTVAEDRRTRVLVELFREWSERPLRGAPRRIHLHFWRRPTAITGTQRVRGIELVRTRDDGAPPLSLPTELVIRAIGYRGREVPGLPFDPDTGTIPSSDGRVIADGEVMPGVYVTGWLRRGPTGVIATNRSDANEVAASVLADLDSLPPRTGPHTDLSELLASREIRAISWDDWLRLEAHEKAEGQAHGADPIVVHDLKTVLEVIARGDE